MGKETFPCASPTRCDQIGHAQGGFHSTEEDAGDVLKSKAFGTGKRGFATKRLGSVGWTFQDR